MRQEGELERREKVGDSRQGSGAYLGPHGELVGDGAREEDLDVEAEDVVSRQHVGVLHLQPREEPGTQIEEACESLAPVLA